MTLKEKIETNYKNSLKSKNKVEISTYRLILSGIKDIDIINRSGSDIKETDDEDIKKLLRRISNLLNNNQDKNFICDNWFKWHKDWWKDEQDNSLQQLKEKLKFHEIKLFYISVPFEKAYEGYMKKGKIPYLIQFENYKNTMKERQKNLLKKISKWEIQ